MSAESIFDRIVKTDYLQVAYVTKDLVGAMERFEKLLGGPKFFTSTINSVENLTYRGEPSDSTWKQGIAYFGDMMYEFIQPISGENTYTEVLGDADDDVIMAHHLGFGCATREEFRSARDELIAKGYPVVQGGLFGETEFAYFDLRKELGTFLEILWLDPPTAEGFKAFRDGTAPSED